MTTRRIAILLLLGCASAYLFTASINTPNIGDSPFMFAVSKRIVEHGFSPIAGADQAATFSKLGLGQSLLNLPVTWAYIKALEERSVKRIYYTLVIAAWAAFLAALGPCLVFLIGCELGYRHRVALLAALSYAFATMHWVYSQALLADATLGMLWLLAFACLLRYRQDRKVWLLALAGVGCGFAVLTKIIAVLALPIFAALAWHCAGKSRAEDKPSATPLLVFGAATAVMVLAVLWYNDVRYDHWFNFGYREGRDHEYGFNTSMWVGLFGLLLSPGKSFFLYNPCALLAVAGLAASYRRHRWETLAMAALALVMVLAHAKWWAWAGDWAWGPRFLAGLPGFFCLLALPTLNWLVDAIAMRRYCVRVVSALVALFVSVLVQLPGLAIAASDYITLATNESKIFGPSGFYHPVNWPIRDDLVALHFIPEFSPISGHVWMLRCVLNPGDKTLRETPPWASLNSQWHPQDPHDNYFKHNIWWLFAWQNDIPQAGRQLVLALCCLLIAGCILVMAWRATSPVDTTSRPS